MFGQLLPVTKRLLVRGDTAPHSCNGARGDQPVWCGSFGDKQLFFSAVGVHTFSTAGLGIIIPFLGRLVLSSPVVTAMILQQSALLQARSSPYSADGGETTLFGGYSAHRRAVGTYGHSDDNAASSTTVGATTPL